MKKSVVVVGSVNMDLMLRCARLPAPGQTVQGGDFRTVPGGKGANQAVAAARLGAPVALIGCVGTDGFATQAIAALRAEGIDLSHLHRAAQHATGVAMVLVEDSGENSIVLAAGANHALDVAHIDAAAAVIEGAAVLVCQLETPLAVVERAVAIAHAASVPVLLNPAPAQALPDTLLQRLNWLVPNEGEAALLAGGAAGPVADAAALAQALHRRGASTVLVTLGARGVMLADARGSTHHPAVPAHAIDTTGAGDCFVGALAAAFAQGLSLAAALQLAQRAAAYSVARPGALASMPRRTDLQPLPGALTAPIINAR